MKYSEAEEYFKRPNARAVIKGNMISASVGGCIVNLYKKIDVDSGTVEIIRKTRKPEVDKFQGVEVHKVGESRFTFNLDHISSIGFIKNIIKEINQI